MEEGREGQASIPEAIIEEEKRRGFTRPGMYLKRRRYCTDGLVVGTAEEVSVFLKVFRDAGLYLRRCNPISQLGGLFFTLREQRSHCRS